MGELVRGNVVDHRERCLHQPPVEADVATPGAAAPLRLRVGERKAAGGAPQPPRKACEPPAEEPFRPVVEPGAHQRADLGIERRMDTQGVALALDVNEQRSPNVEDERASKVAHFGQRLGEPLRCARLDAGPGAMQPVVLLPHIAFDFGAGGPARCVDAHFAWGDGQAQGAAAARAAQLIRDAGAADLQDAAISVR